MSESKSADPKALRRIVAAVRDWVNLCERNGQIDARIKLEYIKPLLSALEEPPCTAEERDVLNALAKCKLPRFDSVYSNISRLPFEPGDDRIAFEVALSEWRATLEESAPPSEPTLEQKERP